MEKQPVNRFTLGWMKVRAIQPYLKSVLQSDEDIEEFAQDAGVNPVKLRQLMAGSKLPDNSTLQGTLKQLPGWLGSDEAERLQQEFAELSSLPLEPVKRTDRSPKTAIKPQKQAPAPTAEAEDIGESESDEVDNTSSMVPDPPTSSPIEQLHTAEVQYPASDSSRPRSPQEWHLLLAQGLLEAQSNGALTELTIKFNDGSFKIRAKGEQ